MQLEIAPGIIIKTTGYNGSAPGPFLRFRDGQEVTVDVINETKDPEILHWHGLFFPPEAVRCNVPSIPFRLVLAKGRSRGAIGDGRKMLLGKEMGELRGCPRLIATVESGLCGKSQNGSLRITVSVHLFAYIGS